MGKSRAAKRRADRARAKAMKKAQAARDASRKAQLAAELAEAAQPEDEENLCGLCAFPMVGTALNKTVNTKRAQFPELDWKSRGCECPEVKICMDCIFRESLRSAQRCCLDPNCDRILIKCPWCRAPMGFENLYYDWVHNDC